MGIRDRLKVIVKNRLGIVNNEPRPAASYTPSNPAPKKSYVAPPRPAPMTDEEALAKIDSLVNENPVVVFMKGTPNAPQCGFSAAVVDVLERAGYPYITQDVISEPAIRSKVKEYSDWPTIPQVYIDGEFMGGCDIVKEMEGNGELKEALEAVYAKQPASGSASSEAAPAE